MRKFLKVLVIAFIIVAINGSVRAKEVPKADSSDYIEVTYFHATVRCQGCIAIENFTVESLEAEFGKELKSGKLKYISLDFLQPENEHFVDEFKIEAQTLIIAQKSNGKIVRWKNLDKIWEVSDNIQNFSKYIKKEVGEFIASKPIGK